MYIPTREGDRFSPPVYLGSRTFFNFWAIYPRILGLPIRRSMTPLWLTVLNTSSAGTGWTETDASVPPL